LSWWKFETIFVASIALWGCAAHTRIATAPLPSAMEQQVHNAVDAGEGDFEIKALRARVDADPANLNTRIELARRYQQKGFPDIALEHLRLAVERAPESSDVAVALAKLLRDTGRATDGAAFLTAFAAKHQPNLDVWAWLGILRDDAGDWKGGEAAYREALALAPDHDDLHNNLGYCLLRQGRKNEAESEFRAALQLNPRSVIARNNLGTSLADKPNEAVVHLQSVADPASAHNNVAVALMEAGNYAAARKEIDIALGYNRQHTAALNNLRLLSELDGKPAEFKAVARPEHRSSRLQGAWRRLWGAPPAGQETKDSGSGVASR
jgi:Flp pilus assembly protein TadD